MLTGTAHHSLIHMFRPAEETILECCVRENQTLFQFFIEQFEPEQSMQILMENKYGKRLLTQISQIDDKLEILEYVLDYTKQVTLKMDAKKELHRQLVQESLAQKAIFLLSHLVESYIVPIGQQKAKKYALVYNNIRNREVEGAEEAQTVREGLEQANYTVLPSLEDWTAQQLKDKLRRQIRDVHSSCSLLLVFIMAHGLEGCVIDREGEYIPIEQLLEIIHNGMPPGIPKILFVQACQKRRAGDTQEFSLFSTYFDLPNKTEAFSRVMSAMVGQSSNRNKMLPALVKELNTTDNFDDMQEFHKIVDGVAKKMEEDGESDVTVCEDSLKKSLYL